MTVQITSENEKVIEVHPPPPQKNLGPDSFSGKLYQTFKELIAIFSNSSKKQKMNSKLMSSALPWYPNQTRIQETKLQANIPEHRCKNLHQNISKSIKKMQG